MICRLRQCSLPITIENGWSNSVVMLRYQSRFGFWRHNWMRLSSPYLFEKFEPSIRKGTYEVLTWYRFTRNWKSPGKKHSSLTSSEQEKIVNVASNSRRWRSKFLKLQFRFWIFNFTRSFPKQIILAYFYFSGRYGSGRSFNGASMFPDSLYDLLETNWWYAGLRRRALTSRIQPIPDLGKNDQIFQEIPRRTAGNAWLSSGNENELLNFLKNLEE